MTVPALLIAFEHDVQFLLSPARKAAAGRPQPSFTEIKGVAHGNGPFEAADEIGQAMLWFFG